ncbi:cysteine proteinase [Hanseniaspora valbyensis NRRL Y-1626]|uniref:Cysteine proteinase n=1 Tax=Hanseniaspora valbyensis NRRL Y-1626 TaxID=766949 RepID=A0A1B7TFX7_9ASCO|nr:cysteine proteinase [Hanseniaspora valbyensis NRRL Y-1626]
MAYGRSLRNGTRKRKLNYNGPLNNMKKPKIKQNKETKSLETNTNSNNNTDDILEIDASLLKIDSESDRDVQNANSSKNTTDDNSLKNVNIVASPSKRTLQGAKKTKTYLSRSPLTKNDSGIESSFDNGANTSKKNLNKKNNTSLSDILNKMNQRKVSNQTIDFSFENELNASDDLAFVVNEDNTLNNKKNKISSLDQFNKYSSVRANRINSTNKKNQSEKEIVHLSDEEGKDEKEPNEDVNISNMKEKENNSHDIDIHDLTSKRNGLSDVKTPIRFNTAKIIWKNQNGNYNYQYFDKNKEKLQLGASFSSTFFELLLEGFTTDKISYENVEIFSYKTGFEAVVLEFKTPIKLRKANSKSTGSLQSVVILKVVCLEFSPNKNSESQLPGLLTERFEKANSKLIVNKNYKITFRTQLKDKYKLGDEIGLRKSNTTSSSQLQNSRFNSLKDKTYNSLTKQQLTQKGGPSYSNKGNVISSPSSGINKSNQKKIETHKEASTSLSRNGIDPGSFFGNNSSNKHYASSLRGLRKLEDVSKIDEKNLKSERENAKPNASVVFNNQNFSGRVTRSKTGSSNPKTRKRYTEIFDDTEYEKTQPLEMDLKHFFSDGSSLIIHDKDYQCLFNGQWLNGTVIDFFNKFFKDDVFKLQVTPKLENLKNVEMKEEEKEEEKKEEKKEEKETSLNKSSDNDNNCLNEYTLKLEDNIKTEESERNPHLSKDFYIFSSYFFLTLDNLEKVVQSRWLLKDDCAVMKKHKYHIIPVNINYHWFGCILEDFYEKCLETQSMIKEFEAKKEQENLEKEKSDNNDILKNPEDKDQDLVEEEREEKNDINIEKDIFFESSEVKTRDDRYRLKTFLNSNLNSKQQQKLLTLRTKDLPKITIYVFDSLRNLHQKELQPIKDFLILFALKNFNIKLNPVQLKLRNSQVIKQPNMNDCGVHLISNIKVFMKFTEKTIKLWNSCSFTGDDPELISFFKETYVKTSRKPLREILASLLEIAKTKKDSNNIALEPMKIDSKSDSEDDELMIIEKNSAKKKIPTNENDDISLEKNEHKIKEPSVLQKLSDLQLEEEEEEEEKEKEEAINKNFTIDAESKKAANEEIDRVFAESDSETSDDKNPITSNSQDLKLAHEIDLFFEKTDNNKQSDIEELNKKKLTSNTSKYFDKKNSTKPSVNSGLLKDRKDNIAKSSQNIESSDQEFTNDDYILYEKDEEKLKDLDELSVKIQAAVNPEHHDTGNPILILRDSNIQKQSSSDALDFINFNNDTNNSQIDSLSDNIRHKRKRKIKSYKD